MKARPSCLLALAAVLTISSTGRGATQTNASLEGWSVLLITLDTTRQDHLGCYGDEAARTPALDGLAERGVLFENAVAQSPITLPSHASIMTGKYPPAHGVRGNSIYVLPSSQRTLAEILAERGYQTAAVIGAIVLDRRYGLAQGFAQYDDDHAALLPMAEHIYRARSAAGVTAAALRLAAGFERTRPYFLWVHYFDPHAPYSPPPHFAAPFAANALGRYSGEIAAMDDAIAKLLDGLEWRDLMEQTLVVVIGDHGEGIAGPHDEPTHGLLLYEDTLRIPLIFSARGALAQGRRVSRLARQVDVLPTVLDLLSIQSPPAIQGGSLRRLLHGTAEAAADPIYAYSESLLGWDTFGWAPVYQIQTAEWKFIEAPRPELYHLATDPAESKNLAGELPEKVEELRHALREFQGASASSARVPGLVQGQDVKRLEALGYVVSFGELPEGMRLASLRDPKDGLVLYRMLERAHELNQEGKTRSAIEILEQILEQDPGNVAAMQQISLSQRRIGDHTRALFWLERLVELRPEDPISHSLLAEHRAARAIRLRKSGELTAVAKLEDQSIEGFRRAIAQGSLEVAVYVNLGLLYKLRGAYVEAERVLQRALELDPQSFDGNFQLGSTLCKAGRPGDAEPYVRAVQSLASSDPVQQQQARILSALHQKKQSERPSASEPPPPKPVP